MLPASIRHPKNLRLIIMAAVLIAICAVAIVFIRYRQAAIDPEEFIATAPFKADLSIGAVHQIATRDGKKEWRLDADSAHYLNSENRVILNDLAMTFFMENQREVLLTARQGILRTDTKDIVVDGSVVLTSDDSRLTTEKLSYAHENRLISTDSPVNITGNAYKLSAESMLLDLDRDKVEFVGNVKGHFSEDFSL